MQIQSATLIPGQPKQSLGWEASDEPAKLELQDQHFPRRVVGEKPGEESKSVNHKEMTGDVLLSPDENQPNSKKNKPSQTITEKDAGLLKSVDDISWRIQAFENNTKRIVSLREQQQAVRAAEEEDKLVQERQQMFINNIKSRIETAYATAWEVHEFLKGMINNRTANEEDLNKICEIATMDTGTLKQTGSAVMTMRKTSRHEHKRLLSKVFKPCVDHAKNVLSDMKMEVASLSNKGNLLLSNLDNARNAMQEQWEKYEIATENGLMSLAKDYGCHV